MKRHILSRLALLVLVFSLFILSTEPVAAVIGSWSSTGSALFYTDGNVGIGTNNPQSKLSVVGGMRIDPLILPPPLLGTPPLQPPAAELLFGSKGQIKSVDANHMIYFRPLDNVMEFREAGQFMFLPGYGTTTNRITMSDSGTLNVLGGSLNVSNSFYTNKGLISLKPQDTLREGGQLLFQGSGTNKYFYLDNYDSHLRLVTADDSGESTKLSFLNNGDMDLQKSFYASQGYVNIKAQDSVNEGGQLILRGAGTNKYVYIDNVSGNFRVVTPNAAGVESVKLQVNGDGDICIGNC